MSPRGARLTASVAACSRCSDLNRTCQWAHGAPLMKPCYLHAVGCHFRVASSVPSERERSLKAICLARGAVAHCVNCANASRPLRGATGSGEYKTAMQRLFYFRGTGNFRACMTAGEVGAKHALRLGNGVDGLRSSWSGRQVAGVIPLRRCTRSRYCPGPRTSRASFLYWHVLAYHVPRVTVRRGVLAQKPLGRAGSAN